MEKQSVCAMLEFKDATNELELRVCSYLTAMIGNLQFRELILFLRFVTGASACNVPKIKVEFNALSVFGHRHTHAVALWNYQLPTTITKTFIMISRQYLTLKKKVILGEWMPCNNSIFF